MNVTNSDSVPLLRLSFDSKKSALASNAIMSNKDSSLRRKLSSMRCLSLRSIVDEELIDVDSSDNNSDVEDNSINDKDIMIQKSSGRRRALLRTLSGKIILNIQSICSGNSKNKKLHNDGKSVATTRSITKKKVIVSDLPNCKRLPPKIYFEAYLNFKGYVSYRFDTLKSGYSNKPTALQVASWGTYLDEIIRKRSVKLLMDFLSCGISSNPSTADGRTLIHELCLRNEVALFKVVLECYQKQTSSINCNNLVQVCDIYGRTPLHYLCTSINPSLEIADIIFKLDSNLVFMADCDGKLPLECIPIDLWPQWIRFFHNMLPEYLPYRDLDHDGPQSLPSMTLVPPNTYPLSNPNLSVTPIMASIVSNGYITPSKAKQHAKPNNTMFDIEDYTTIVEDIDGSCCSESIGENDIFTFLTAFHAENKTDLFLHYGYDDFCNVAAKEISTENASRKK